MKFTIDVDYSYPSRAKSFLYTVLRLKIGRDYLKNPKIIARMINESTREVRASWFFTPTTTPDDELLNLLDKGKHEVALHIANNPYAELQLLEKATQRKISHYTIHGTARVLARIMWRRKLSEAKAQVPNDFPLKYMYEHPPAELDALCYSYPTPRVVKIAEDFIAQGEILHFHPEWLFQRGKINRRGPVYEVLKRILKIE